MEHEFSRTIGCPALHAKASRNCGMFERGPLTRHFGSECGPFFYLCYLRGGMDIPSPLDIPGVSDDLEDELEDIEDYEEKGELDLKTEEVFEADAAIDDLGDDDDF